MFKNKKRAFTLSEVLIALSIIGVIAVITIPRTINNTQNKASILKLKRAYTVVQDAVKISSVRLNYDFGDITSLATGADVLRSAQDLLVTSLDASVVSNTYNGAGFPLTYSNAGVPQLSNTYSSTASISANNDLKFAGRNGVLYIIKAKSNMANGCTVDKPCILYIDINGAGKGPNEVALCTSGNNNLGTIPNSDSGVYVEPVACTVGDGGIADIYPFIIYDTEVRPATSAVVGVLER